MLEPIARQSLSQAVYARLRDGIVTGELGSGTNLPSERELAETLQVNRGAVREALKRLEQARLVSVRHGGGAHVLDYQSSAGLDLLSELLFSGGNLNVALARDVLEVRACLGPEIARRCAERGGAPLAERLDALVEGMAADDDLVRRQALVMEFWATLVDGSHNLAFRLAHNSLMASYDTFSHLLTHVLEEELRALELFRAVSTAVRAGDGDAARAAAEALLALGERSLTAMLDTLDALSKKGPK
jgi:GntR family transcriptional repressor for pyruvate dehydrogenase complex